MNTHKKTVPNWAVVNWRRLEKGETIELGDWVDNCNDGWRDDPLWEQTSCVGQKAPDP